MLFLFWLLMLMKMMKMMKSEETVTAHSGGGVLLSSHLQQLKGAQDVRWTHPRLVMSLKNNVTTCHHGRCQLLSDGSLTFSRVQSEDSGTYNLEVFDEDGTRVMKKDFLLRVDDSSSSSSSVVGCVLICLLLFLLLFFIIFFILTRRKRRMKGRGQSMRTAGPLEENTYVVMHGYHGNKKKTEEKPESHYVPCNPVVSMETPITEQTSVDGEDIYV